MARKRSLSSLGQMTELNLTPLMDLAFTLLITFVMTFPLIEQGIPINLPKGKAADLKPDKAATVSLDKNGKIYLDEVAMPAEEVGARLKQRAQGNPQLVVMVRADESLRYSDVVKMMKILHDANVSKLALVTQEEEEKPRR